VELEKDGALLRLRLSGQANIVDAAMIARCGRPSTST